MKYNGKMNHNLKYVSTIVHIYTYFPHLYFHVNQSTLWIYVFDLFTITLSFTIKQINEDRNVQLYLIPTKKGCCYQIHKIWSIQPSWFRGIQITSEQSLNTVHDKIIPRICQWSTSIRGDRTSIKMCLSIMTYSNQKKNCFYKV